ncbi:IS607 family transposase [Desulfolucanica intricata]|uniref:IS607 family transposase n=1 Tax=Desulfolucanica intricata TaxID=1285191 RepID=UPI0008328C3F|nr:IS607 family transposase [Desulfolucanica intricata]
MYTIREAAKLLGVSVSTLRRWESEGKIRTQRTKGGHRRYTIEELSGIKPLKFDTKLTIGYCRVSSGEQKADLARQVENVTQYCIAKGYQLQIITDIGSGLNYKKKGLKELLTLIQSNKVERVVINYKDRLIRFGYELLEQVCEFHGVAIEIINHTEDKTYEQELVEDIFSIIKVFSSRLYGSRSHKQKKIIEENKNLFTLG